MRGSVTVRFLTIEEIIMSNSTHRVTKNTYRITDGTSTTRGLCRKLRRREDTGMIISDEILLTVKRLDTINDIHGLIDDSMPGEDCVYAGIWAYFTIIKNELRPSDIPYYNQASQLLDQIVDAHPIYNKSRGLDYFDKDKAIKICLGQFDKRLLKSINN